MNRIREILLNEYIGAIAIGMVFANAIGQLVGAIISPGMTLWQRSSVHASVLTESGGIAWPSFIRPFVSAVLLLLAGYVLIYWLYLRPENTESTEARPDNSEI